MRSGLAWKLSRSGRSTVILRNPKCVVGKMLADDDLFLVPVLRNLARVAVLEVGENLENVLCPLERDLAALVARGSCASASRTSDASMS